MTNNNEKNLQHFVQMLVLNNILDVKVPDAALNNIKQIANTFFATTENIQKCTNINSLETMQEQFDIIDLQELIANDFQGEVNDKSIYFFGCGISGYGIQNWKFQYILSSPKLRIMVSVPYGNAYGNPEEEQKKLNFSLKLIELCLTNLLHEKEHKLSFILDDEMFAYAVNDEQNQEIESGDFISNLLDVIVKQDRPSMDNTLWV